jgi:hypothetical protein
VSRRSKVRARGAPPSCPLEVERPNLLIVRPQEARDRQIAIYRRMTGEQRLAVALRLHELPCEMAREGIRRQHPDADAAEVERLLRARLVLARGP